ncbi:helix-turn-helix domain-containing protein [Desertibacillus haloalkaliphilus]|uniref:helix-turn-helix domain-containing protein n=1 Tax=Desertibacillus haloalkaliphilus TaxID=1328930 RepID=UPI001C2619E7|nr:helix-turn-helix domain-containing protein [Desertibacillus haloalkaliphilus]MBU8909020.1 helix-turn-helix domain-containing protein [Desertibacillus haloalkaliphilus]
MSTSIIITADQFKEMTTYKSYVSSEENHQKVKLSLLNDIRKIYGEKWYRVKGGTRKAIDYLAWFAAERGFAFPSSEHIGEKYSISDRTVRNIIKKLEDNGLIIKIYRRAKKTNSIGKPIFLFTNHPYFNYWTEFLKLDFHADFHAENAETSSESKPEAIKNKSTIDLTYLISLINKRKEINLEDLDHTYTPSHIPKEFINITKPFFKSALMIYKLWGRVKTAYKNSSLDRPLEDLLPIIIQAFKETIFSKKAGKIKGDFKGYFYGTIHRMFVVERRNEISNEINWL